MATCLRPVRDRSGREAEHGVPEWYFDSNHILVGAVSRFPNKRTKYVDLSKSRAAASGLKLDLERIGI